MGRSEHTFYLYALKTDIFEVSKMQKLQLEGYIHSGYSLAHFQELF